MRESIPTLQVTWYGRRTPEAWIGCATGSASRRSARATSGGLRGLSWGVMRYGAFRSAL
jgi:hypothetical protein